MFFDLQPEAVVLDCAAPLGVCFMAVKSDKCDRHRDIRWMTTRRIGAVFNAPLVSRFKSVIKRVPRGRIRVLDIGCGDGYLACQIAKQRPDSQVTGIDSDLRGILIARQFADAGGLKNVRFDLNQSDGLPFPPSSFDLVIMTDVIERLPEPQFMLAEMKRVLAPGGTAIVTTPNRHDGSKWDHRHGQNYTAEELRRELEHTLGPTKVIGSWHISYVRSWRRNRIGRFILDLSARLGRNAFDKEVENPSREYGQLTAVSRL